MLIKKIVIINVQVKPECTVKRKTESWSCFQASNNPRGLNGAEHRFTDHVAGSWFSPELFKCSECNSVLNLFNVNKIGISIFYCKYIFKLFSLCLLIYFTLVAGISIQTCVRCLAIITIAYPWPSDKSHLK